VRRNWLAVARKDVADASRSWMLYVLAALLVAMFGLLVFGEGLTYEPRETARTPNPPDTPHASLAFGDIARWGGIPLVPLVALVVGYLAIAGEREGGSLRLLLGHPVTRLEVLVGKFLGRTVVVWTPLLLALGIAGAGIPVLFRQFGAGAYAVLVGLLLLEAGGYVAVAVGISAAAHSRALAMGGVISTYVATVFAWDILPLSLHYLAFGDTPTNVIGEPTEVPGWFFLLTRLRPQAAFDVAVEWYADPRLPGGERPGETVGRYAVESGDPFFAEPWFALVVLVAWVVVPLAVGYWRFSGADLG
jgi:ABC-2 type transport system permease protein